MFQLLSLSSMAQCMSTPPLDCMVMRLGLGLFPLIEFAVITMFCNTNWLALLPTLSIMVSIELGFMCVGSKYPSPSNTMFNSSCVVLQLARAFAKSVRLFISIILSVSIWSEIKRSIMLTSTTSLSVTLQSQGSVLALRVNSLIRIALSTPISASRMVM